MKTSKQTQAILDKLESQHPDADTELHYTTPFELLVATMLSAQSTDQRVNMVTPALFKRYPNARTLSKSTTAELEPQILTTGFFRQKSKALISMANALVDNHGGEVPRRHGSAHCAVGRRPQNRERRPRPCPRRTRLPVDRHVLRVSNRIGIAGGEDAVKVEGHLSRLLPPARWTRASDTMILHGRRICKPKPLCDQCAVQDDCDYFHAARRPAPSRAARKPKRPRR